MQSTTKKAPTTRKALASTPTAVRRTAKVSGDPRSIRDQVIAFKREQVIQAAAELFFTNGYQQTTLEEVAQSLNVTKPFIYYHFKDKEDLLYEISERAIAAANATLRAAIDKPGTPPERLHWAITTMMKAVIDQQRCTAVFFREQKNLSEQSRAPIYAQHREYDRLLLELLNDGLRRGEFIIADPHLCALGLSGMTGWAYNWYRPDGRLSADEISKLMAEMALRTVGVNEKTIRALASA
jgi:AcrR family transcriptional regulator